jgi:hypothetical protein
MKTLRPACLASFAVSIAVTLFVLSLAESAPAATILSEWADGNSNWNNPANWNPAIVPNNDAVNQFDAFITNGSTVTLDTSVTVNGLGISSNALTLSRSAAATKSLS